MLLLLLLADGGIDSGGVRVGVDVRIDVDIGVGGIFFCGGGGGGVVEVLVVP